MPCSHTYTHEKKTFFWIFDVIHNGLFLALLFNVSSNMWKTGNFSFVWGWFRFSFLLPSLWTKYDKKTNPGWAIIDIQSFSALIQRFLRFQRCSELNQPTLILTSLVITDSVMNISEYLWFSAEHYWQAANRQRPWKKPTKSVFLSILMLKRREIENFRITFNGLFWKIVKMWFFRNLYFLLIPCQKTSY